MTLKLYLHDTYKWNSIGKVTDIVSDDIGFGIILDSTVFYPQGGGQPCDTGTLENDVFKFNVYKVRSINDDLVIHYVKENTSNLNIDSKLECKINKEMRLLHARYHTLAHLIGNISEIILPDFKAVKAHVFPNEAYVEFNSVMDVTRVDNLENISQNLTEKLIEATKNGDDIVFFDIDRSLFEEKYYALPYFIPANKSFRCVRIGDYLPVPCCGTHLKNTKEIGDFSLKVKSKNGILRVSYNINNQFF